jgi:hypothetical protein
VHWHVLMPNLWFFGLFMALKNSFWYFLFSTSHRCAGSAKLKISSPPTSYENEVLKINFTVSSQKCGRIIKISFRPHKFEPAKCGKIGNFADPGCA